MIELQTVARLAEQRRKALDYRKSQRDLLLKQKNEYLEQIARTESTIELLDKAVAVIGQFADVREQAVQERIEAIVSDGLRSVFNEDLSLVVEQKVVGKRTDIKFSIVSNYNGTTVKTDILSARGGGVAAVTGFLLRVVMILLTDSARVLFLDETFAQVSDEYMENVSRLLDELADEYGFQFIIVAHRAPELEGVSDTIYKASAVDGTTSYKVI